MGKLHFLLNGTKLQGDGIWTALGRKTNGFDPRRGGHTAGLEKARRHLLAGKTMAELAKGDRVWHSGSLKATPSAEDPAQRSPCRRFRPMMAVLVDSAPRGESVYEDQVRRLQAIALKGSHETRLLSRNERTWEASFPKCSSNFQLKAKDAIVDGEVVALNEQGLSSFHAPGD